MSKIIVERPRLQAERRGFRRSLQGDPDLMASQESMKLPHIRHWGGKQLNENLAPLRRFLQSRVGSKWNDVYSEIAKHLRITNTVQQHVRDHLNDYVAIKTKLIDGEIWTNDLFGFSQLENSWRLFYVDPRDGTLQENLAHRKKLQQQDLERKAQIEKETKNAYLTSTGVEYRKVGGIWYQSIWDVVPSPPNSTASTEADQASTKTVCCIDVFTGKAHTVPGERYRQAKKQASSRELKQHNLQNDR